MTGTDVRQHGFASMGWSQYDTGHVMPVNDLMPHVHSEECWCVPTDDGGAIIHHAMDRREDYEDGNLRLH